GDGEGRTDHAGHANHTGHADHAGHADHTGHDGHAGHGGHVGQFRRLFWVMLVLAVPVVGLNEMFAGLVGYGLPEGAWVRWVSPVLGTVISLWGGRPFLSGSVSEIRACKPGMILLIWLAHPVTRVGSSGATK